MTASAAGTPVLRDSVSRCQGAFVQLIESGTCAVASCRRAPLTFPALEQKTAPLGLLRSCMLQSKKQSKKQDFPRPSQALMARVSNA